MIQGCPDGQDPRKLCHSWTAKTFGSLTLCGIARFQHSNAACAQFLTYKEHSGKVNLLFTGKLFEKYSTTQFSLYSVDQTIS